MLQSAVILAHCAPHLGQRILLTLTTYLKTELHPFLSAQPMSDQVPDILTLPQGQMSELYPADMLNSILAIRPLLAGDLSILLLLGIVRDLDTWSETVRHITHPLGNQLV